MKINPNEMISYYQMALFLYDNTKDEELKARCKEIIDKVNNLLNELGEKLYDNKM